MSREMEDMRVRVWRRIVEIPGCRLRQSEFGKTEDEEVG